MYTNNNNSCTQVEINIECLYRGNKRLKKKKIMKNITNKMENNTKINDIKERAEQCTNNNNKQVANKMIVVHTGDHMHLPNDVYSEWSAKSDRCPDV